MTKTIAEVIDAAADEIEAHGWRRNGFGERGCAVCMWGALRAAADPECVLYSESLDARFISTIHSSYYDRAIAIGRFTTIAKVFIERNLYADYGYRQLANWNDAQRDKRKVVRALRRYAERARAEGV